MEGGFDASMSLLLNISIVAHRTEGTMPAQGVATYSPPFIVKFLNGNDGISPPTAAFAPAFPEFFDEGGTFPKDWPNTERSIQNAEASIVDAIVRSVFGWRPQWATFHEADPHKAIQASLYLPDVPRRSTGKMGGQPLLFRGTLQSLRTPFGPIDITCGEDGLSWRFSTSTRARSAQ